MQNKIRNMLRGDTILIFAFLLITVAFGLHLNYAIDLIAGAVFYLLASVWFMKRRYQFVDKAAFIAPVLEKWGKPKL